MAAEPAAGRPAATKAVRRLGDGLSLLGGSGLILRPETGIAASRSERRRLAGRPRRAYVTLQSDQPSTEPPWLYARPSSGGSLAAQTTLDDQRAAETQLLRLSGQRPEQAYDLWLRLTLWACLRRTGKTTATAREFLALVLEVGSDEVPSLSSGWSRPSESMQERICLQVLTGYYLALRLAAEDRAALGLVDAADPDASTDDDATASTLSEVKSRPPPQRLVLLFLTTAVLTAAPPLDRAHAMPRAW